LGQISSAALPWRFVVRELIPFPFFWRMKFLTLKRESFRTIAHLTHEKSVGNVANRRFEQCLRMTSTVDLTDVTAPSSSRRMRQINQHFIPSGHTEANQVGMLNGSDSQLNGIGQIAAFDIKNWIAYSKRCVFELFSDLLRHSSRKQNE
jgi:hypothetical protein